MGANEPPELADADPRQGRIGYGRYSRYSPLLLGLALVVALVVIYWVGRGGGEDASVAPEGPRGGEVAPDVTLTLLDGAPLRLADLRGSVIVLNFWASWCPPCKEEMPAFERYAEEAAKTGEKTVVVGVGVRTDQDAAARALVTEERLTYPIGRDTATDQPGIGPIEAAFEVPNAYPSTVVIRPDGVVDPLRVGPLNEAQLRLAVDRARSASGPVEPAATPSLQGSVSPSARGIDTGRAVC